MAYPKPPKTKNLTICGLRPEIKAMFDTFVEIKCTDSKALFEGMLYDWCQKFLNIRAREVGVSPELLEAVEDGIEQAFHSTVLHNARYQRLDNVQPELRAQVMAKMVRQK